MEWKKTALLGNLRTVVTGTIVEDFAGCQAYADWILDF